MHHSVESRHAPLTPRFAKPSNLICSISHDWYPFSNFPPAWLLYHVMEVPRLSQRSGR